MAEITVKGWVNKPSTGTSAKGPYSKFTLAESQKQKDGTYNKVFYNVADFNSGTPPEDGSKVQLTGYLKMRSYEKDGQTRMSYDIVANTVELVEGPKPKSETPTAPATQPDPWDV